VYVCCVLCVCVCAVCLCVCVSKAIESENKEVKGTLVVNHCFQ